MRGRRQRETDGLTLAVLDWFGYGAVWCVNVLANGDIAAGASDGNVRVYTRSKERIASEADLAVRASSLLGARLS